ncbi:MAG: MFS transporter, partial [Bdellovibrionales bacterium]|nr:MFS transporter [Bdellovibrionales bacterium]
MKNVIRSYCGFQFFFSLLIWLPVFHEYQLRIGLTNGQVFDIQSIYYLAFCLVEIPTGMMADRFGYRRCLIWGGIVLVIANLLAIFMQNYEGLLGHFLLVALARSLVSGASSAYIYDFLKGQNSTSVYRDIEGKARAYGLVGKVICWVAVGSLLDWHLTSPYWMTTLAALVSVGFAVALPEVFSTPEVI